ncbi:MAG: SAM-dependent methyltransferase [Candidatus Methanohalarchaeum thermophilum]|uniref:SAM-dependent methyltransferase n=1 Tax=Methanohalarchaeum thermophilum TaxID=1903181 RepID=A0A1Q6DUK7_METT1|nr:MAG: SAM-dependent methyltransferase [Candidatus Methanohalarchaeum thermophilum]
MADKKEVQDLYDKISSDFSERRNYPWPEVVDYIENSKKGKNAIDLGCGNGRHIPHLSQIYETVIGLDISKAMLCEARYKLEKENLEKQEFELIQGDITYIPFKDEVFDCIINIATFHHLPTTKDRIKALNEMFRVLKEDKEVLFSVWSIEHEYFDGNRKEIRENDFDYNVTWESNGRRLERYYHIFDEKRLKRQLGKSDFEIKSLELSSGNYYVRLHKP